MIMKHTMFSTRRQAFMVFLLSAMLVIFAASCSQVAPANHAANTSPSIQPANPEVAKTEVGKFFDEHTAALLKADTATLDRLWADDLVLIDHEGNTLSKTQWRELLTSGTEKIEPGDTSSDTRDVRIYGNTAVVILKVTQRAKLNGKPHDGKMTISSVLVKGERGWQMVLAQLSELKPVSNTPNSDSNTAISPRGTEQSPTATP
jgi:ketosteroid isomerase-like protein